jgi:hypothetical protein
MVVDGRALQSGDSSVFTLYVLTYYFGMITIRPAAERGRTVVGWLDSFHSFSFGDYDDPAHRGFGNLVVINDDRIAPGAGFPLHGHRDMEIITYVLSGAVEHRDSLGSRAIITPGEVQVMTAGRGIRHAEFNPSRDTPLHLLQVWIQPRKRDLPPAYHQRRLERTVGRTTLLASGHGEPDALPIHADARIHGAVLAAGDRLGLAFGCRGWLQVASGSLSLNGRELTAGDGAAISGEPHLTLAAGPSGSESLLFELA